MSPSSFGGTGIGYGFIWRLPCDGRLPTSGTALRAAWLEQQMLEGTFCHFPGVGVGTERRLWAEGVLTWDDVCRDTDGTPVPARVAGMARYVGQSRESLQAGDPLPFYRGLPAREHWRLFPHFRHATAFFDIETTGLSPGTDIITTAALYDGRRVMHYVNGQNLDALPADLARYRLLVTYNGKSFDVPFVEKFFGISLPQAHIDLRYVLGSLGYRGGLKGCEHQLGLNRGDLEGVDGFFAVLLWRDYVRAGNSKALETLLA